MSIQDRTAEFHSVVTLVSRRVKRPASTKPYTDNPNGKRPRSEFAKQAAEVGRSIADTMGKLERLAQRESFDFSIALHITSSPANYARDKAKETVVVVWQ